MTSRLPRFSELVFALAVAFALAASQPTSAAELEQLPAESALADVQAMEGVVLVDLYADW